MSRVPIILIDTRVYTKLAEEKGILERVLEALLNNLEKGQYIHVPLSQIRELESKLKIPKNYIEKTFSKIRRLSLTQCRGFRLVHKSELQISGHGKHEKILVEIQHQFRKHDKVDRHLALLAFKYSMKNKYVKIITTDHELHNRICEKISMYRMEGKIIPLHIERESVNFYRVEQALRDP